MQRWLALLVLLPMGFAWGAGDIHRLSICGGKDDRTLSDEPRTGRSVHAGDRGGCTVSMISASCAVSAGHCTSTLEVMNFNTFLQPDGRLVSKAEDEYHVDPSSIVYRDNGPGDDFSVFKIQANTITGKFPGEVQGVYEISAAPLFKGSDIVTIGYGIETPYKDSDSRQQYGIGKINTVTGTQIDHMIDTMPGNSGGPLIDAATGRLVGVHTHGGCDSSWKVNSGTAISGFKDFQNAINACLATEKR